MTFIATILFTLLTITTSAGCHKKQEDGFNLTGINLNVTSLDLKPGQHFQLRATAVPALANQPDYAWSSTDPAVATVNNGLVIAIGAGQASIAVVYKNIRREIAVSVSSDRHDKNHVVLYEKQLTGSSFPDLVLNGVGKPDSGGLLISGKNDVVRLNRFYALAERKVQYEVVFSADALAIFRSSEGDFNAYVDVKNKNISIATSPVTKKVVNFLAPGRSYLIEIYHIYQLAKLRITDIQSGATAEIEAVHDGQGGAGQGALQNGFAVGMQWDYYCFGLKEGTSMLVRKIAVLALKRDVKLLMYGDSITQPEGYFPTRDFPKAWTQQVIAKLNGRAMSSGRGGAQIDMVLDYIRNELPYIKAKYVMVTIGTNGGNTEEKLTRLADYIMSHGAIPILNNIPSNESGTQVTENKLIEKVRQKKNLNGCRFDLATSLQGDGKEVDKSSMYWEDYTGSYGWQIYHHPNEKGGARMFAQTLNDTPEIYE